MFTVIFEVKPKNEGKEEYLAIAMVFMYTINSLNHGWWERVTLILWGAPAKLVGEDGKLQKLVQDAQNAGVHVTACKACALELGVKESLKILVLKLNIGANR